MRSKKSRFVLCLKSGTYKASLQPRKVYRVLDDPSSARKPPLRRKRAQRKMPAKIIIPVFPGPWRAREK